MGKFWKRLSKNFGKNLDRTWPDLMKRPGEEGPPTPAELVVRGFRGILRGVGIGKPSANSADVEVPSEDS